MGIFVMMIGIPGSGKTWLRQKVFPDAKIICPDELIGYTKEHPWTPHVAKIAWKESNNKFASLLKNESELVVFDATDVTVRHRRKYIEQARSARFQTVGIFCDTPEAICLERNNARDQSRYVPLIVIISMKKRLEPPSLKEGFHLVASIDVVNGVHNFYEAENCWCSDQIKKRFDFLLNKEKQ